MFENMTIKNSLGLLSASLGIVLALCCSCKKTDTPEPVSPVPSNESKVTFEATFSKPLSNDTIISDTLDTYQFKAVFTNNNATKDQVTDSTFIWEQVSASLPKNWIVYICTAGVCHNDTVVRSEFIVPPNKKTDFYIDFAFLDDQNYAKPFGKGTASVEYLIYRKGMKKEDGIKVSVNMTTK